MADLQSNLTDTIKQLVKDVPISKITSENELINSSDKLAKWANCLVKITEGVSVNNPDISGADKRQAVIRVLDDWIKLPAMLEWVDNLILPVIVNLAVAALNTAGKQWGTPNNLINTGLLALKTFTGK
jgi:hypothetical protein